MVLKVPGDGGTAGHALSTRGKKDLRTCAEGKELGTDAFDMMMKPRDESVSVVRDLMTKITFHRLTQCAGESRVQHEHGI